MVHSDHISKENSFASNTHSQPSPALSLSSLHYINIIIIMIFNNNNTKIIAFFDRIKLLHRFKNSDSKYVQVGSEGISKVFICLPNKENNFWHLKIIDAKTGMVRVFAKIQREVDQVVVSSLETGDLIILLDLDDVNRKHCRNYQLDFFDESILFHFFTAYVDALKKKHRFGSSNL